MQSHPDRNPDQDTTKKFQEVTDAYNMLKDGGSGSSGGSAGGGGFGSGGNPFGGGGFGGHPGGGGNPFGGGGFHGHGQRVSEEQAQQIFKDMFGNRDPQDVFRVRLLRAVPLPVL